jgi:hypothetical protein
MFRVGEVEATSNGRPFNVIQHVSAPKTRAGSASTLTGVPISLFKLRRTSGPAVYIKLNLFQGNILKEDDLRAVCIKKDS